MHRCGACRYWSAARSRNGRNLDTSRLTWPVLAAIVYLGAFGTVIGFVWYYEGVKAIGPARTAVFNNLVPVFGISLVRYYLASQFVVDDFRRFAGDCGRITDQPAITLLHTLHR
jgi:hypothetical protein